MPPLNPFQKTGLALVLGQLIGQGANAATITVNSNADALDTDIGSECTLRKALESVNTAALKPGCVNTGGAFGSDDTINIAPSLSGQTITLAGQQLAVGDDNPLATPVSVTLNASDVTINANAQSRGLIINAENNAAISELTIQNGSEPSDFGGAIFVSSSASLALSNSELSNNFSARGGAIASLGDSVTITHAHFTNNNAERGGGAAVFANEQAVRITDSHFVGNKAGYLADNTASSPTSGLDGGAIFAAGGESGSPTLTIENSTLSGNVARDDAGAIALYRAEAQLFNTRLSSNSAQDNGGAVFMIYGSTLVSRQSTFSTNTAGYGGGAISSYQGRTLYSSSVDLQQTTLSSNTSGSQGGSIDFDGGHLTLANSTVSGNLAVSGGGIYAGTQSVTLVLQNTTINNNSASTIGGLHLPNRFSRSSEVTISNTIMANSSGGDCLINDAFDMDAVTLVEDGSCAATTTGDPKLLPLADNGGSTLTHSLARNSPAINTGNNATCLSVDQRGKKRDQRCDIGAFEFIDQGTFFVIPTRNGKNVIVEL